MFDPESKPSLIIVYYNVPEGKIPSLNELQRMFRQATIIKNTNKIYTKEEKIQ